MFSECVVVRGLHFVPLYNFEIEFMNNDIELRNYEVKIRESKFNLRTKGSGKFRFSLVRCIGQLTASVTGQ